ncbi:MAG: DUF3710 domain-containing protein [Mycobacterium sp.]|nr:DUF3710 domain-containing protein [Mycobacterium sp.]
MAFGRRKRQRDNGAVPDPVPDAAVAADGAVEREVVEQTAPPAAGGDLEGGPFDIEEFDKPEEAEQARLDLGSVLIPMPSGAQIQVEFNQTGVPNAIWVVTPNGRFTVAAYAAPKSPGLWREVAAELAEALRNDNAAVSIEDGPWGREVIGVGAGAVRFIGVDGPRWMIRCVVNGTPQSMPALLAQAREALADTVVRRGDTPMPVRTPLQVQLPEQLAAQLRAAQAQQAKQMQAQQAMLAAQQAMFAQQQRQQPQPQPQPPQQDDSEGERRDASGSAMQQLRGTSSTTGG